MRGTSFELNFSTMQCIIVTQEADQGAFLTVDRDLPFIQGFMCPCPDFPSLRSWKTWGGNGLHIGLRQLYRWLRQVLKVQALEECLHYSPPTEKVKWQVQERDTAQPAGFPAWLAEPSSATAWAPRAPHPTLTYSNRGGSSRGRKEAALCRSTHLVLDLHSGSMLNTGRGFLEWRSTEEEEEEV